MRTKKLCFLLRDTRFRRLQRGNPLQDPVVGAAQSLHERSLMLLLRCEFLLQLLDSESPLRKFGTQLLDRSIMVVMFGLVGGGGGIH